MFIPWWVILTFISVLILAIYRWIVCYRIAERNWKEWDKYESYYWMLYSSDAVDRKTYDIHLPSTTYGEERWIRKRTEEEIKERE